MDDDGPVDGDMELVDGVEVVLAVGILRVQPQQVVAADELRCGPAEAPVPARLVDVPGELLGHDPHHKGLSLIREVVFEVRPHGHRKPYQQDRLKHDDANLQVL